MKIKLTNDGYKLEKGADRCRWFLKCDNVATTTLAHPILGDVQICERCKTLATK